MPHIMPTVLEHNRHCNLLREASRYILEQTGDAFPDLRSCVVLLPQASAATAFRQQLLQTLASEFPDYPTSIFPPWAGTLRDWVTLHIPVASDYRLISEQARRLLFIEALREYPDIFKEENKWQVAVALLKLFDELKLQRTDIHDAATWRESIQQAYGIGEHPHCNQEADMVYALWCAWQQQLQDSSLQDASGDYVLRLSIATQLLSKSTLPSAGKTGTYFIIIAGGNYSRCEQDFITALEQKYLCTTLHHSAKNTDESNPQQAYYASFIQQCFAYSDAVDTKSSLGDKNNTATQIATLRERVNAVSADSNKPVDISEQTMPFSCFLSPDDETQVRAIDLQVRQWLLAGQRNIGIVCEDRKLSRRLRALLDRADITMQDLSGWSLATTQAATIIERWLQCIEEDFDSRPLLECLKSPFIQSMFSEIVAPQADAETNSSDTDVSDASDASNNTAQEVLFQDQIKFLVYRFEHDIVLHENINSNLDRYRQSLARRRRRLTHWPGQSFQNIVSMLNTIETIAAPLLALYKSNQTKNSPSIPASDYLSAFKNCLLSLGVIQSYTQDSAGLRILQTLDEMENSLQFANPVFSWQDFRLWLGKALEEKLFSPQTQGSNVKLMTLEQADCLHFDALIIAAVEPKHFPGKANSSPFFNQSVYQALGLNSWSQDYNRRFEKFKQLLFAAPEILLTCLAEEKGETIPVSPWLELLIQFHQQVFGSEPLHRTLATMLNQDIQVFRCDTHELPVQAERPAPTLTNTLIPARFSASSHQRLINCPYLFFCSDALRLKPLEELSTELSKADYGELVHRILQAFHNPLENDASMTNAGNDTKAFKENITENNRERAQQHLKKLSEEYFRKDMEENVLHQSWLQRWLKHIPSYISWQIGQQQNWQVMKTEQQVEAGLNDGYSVYGRLDRIDRARSENKLAIIDYKTGQSARQAEVENGEDVQLTSYAMLEEECSEVMYLSLDASDHRVKTGARLGEEQLPDYRQRTRQRLTMMIDAINRQHPLSAWGDDKACQHCRFSGICRRQQWQEDISA